MLQFQVEMPAVIVSRQLSGNAIIAFPTLCCAPITAPNEFDCSSLLLSKEIFWIHLKAPKCLFNSYTFSMQLFREITAKKKNPLPREASIILAIFDINCILVSP